MVVLQRNYVFLISGNYDPMLSKIPQKMVQGLD